MTSNSNTFSSEGFDLDAIPRGEDAEKILELGGGVSFERPISNEKPVESKSPSSSSTRLSPEIQKAEDFKTKGNDAFKAHDYYGAIVSYTDAIEAVPTDAAAGERTGEEMLRERDNSGKLCLKSDDKNMTQGDPVAFRITIQRARKKMMPKTKPKRTKRRNPKTSNTEHQRIVIQPSLRCIIAIGPHVICI